MFKKLFLLSLLVLAMSFSNCFALDVTHEYGPLEWSFQGKPVPETHWAPWLPVVQTGLRFKLGFLISDGTITVKTPIKLTFRYDPDTVRSGQNVTFAVKAEPASADYFTFQSAFGISFPNKIQVGFVGVSGVPIDLPWFDLPLDFWELVAKVPKVGDTISSAVSNIGVNTSTNSGLPLGKTDSYHNARDLITVELSKYKVEDMAPKIFGKIPENVRTNAVRLIKVATFCSDSEALEKLQDYVEKALTVLYDAPTLTLSGDPYFKLEGIRIQTNIRVYIPGGKGSGLYTLYFDNANQQQTVTFRDITPFINPGDKLTIAVEDIAYEFRLIQGLTAKVQVSVVPFDLDNVEKTVTYTTAVKNVSTDPFKIEIPILPSDSLVQSLRANRGCTSVSVNWASPSVPLKGTVKAYDGNTLVATVIENSFKTAHNVIVPNLQAGKTYRLTVECVNASGQVVPGGEVSATTSGTCPERKESAICNTLTLSNPTATAGPDYVDFSWDTNQLASTEVMFSPSPDLSLNYIMAVKKVGDVVTQGWVTREGPRQFETHHTLRLSGLEPMTKYYYNLRSWTFINNDETNNPQDAVGSTGNITTLQGVLPPTVKIRVRSPSEGNISVPDIPVILTKNTDLDFHLSVSSGTTGVSNDVVLDKGTTYYLQAQPNACYEGGTAELTVSNTAQGPLSETVININKLSPRVGYVLSDPNHGIAGATVTGKNSAGATVTTTTLQSGAWSVNSGFNPGSYTFTVTKDGYRTTTANATVNSCGRFIALPITMVPRNYTLNVTVKNSVNQVVKNASVVIKEGNTTIATLTTDTQGKVTHSGTLNDDNEHTFTIAVTPPTTATSNILPTEDFVTLTSATTRNAIVICPADKKGPVPSQITIAQAGATAIKVTFKLDDEKGKSAVEYLDPQGQTKTTPWKEGMFTPGSGVSDHTVVIQGSSVKPGIYRIKIKTKDKWNNEGGSDIQEFQLFGEGLWNFKAVQSQSTVNFSWNKFPYAEKFGKYTIAIGTQAPIEITDINMTSYTLNNYAATSVKQAKLTAVASDGSGALAANGVVSLQPTGSMQSQQGGQSTQTQTGQSSSGAVVDEKTVLTFSGKPTKAYANQEFSLKVIAKTLKAKKVLATCIVDWGDGKSDTVNADTFVKHTYQSAGTYAIKVTATLQNPTGLIAPLPIGTNMPVEIKPTKLTLTKTKVTGAASTYKFTIKAEEGSFAIGAWTLSFGDGNNESGQGPVSKTINHAYAITGSMTAEFSVTDSSGAMTKKTLSFTVVP